MKRIVLAALVAGSLLVGSTRVALASRGADGCPDDFQLTTVTALNEQYPGGGVGDYASTKDKNQDGAICVKVVTYPEPAPYTFKFTFVDNKER